MEYVQAIGPDVGYGHPRYVERIIEPCGCQTAFDTLLWHGVGYITDGCTEHDRSLNNPTFEAFCREAETQEVLF